MSDPRASHNSRHPPTAEESPALDALAAAFQHAMIGIAIGTPEGRLRDVNPAFARMLGYEREDLLALPFSAVTHTGDHDGDAERWNRLQAGEIDTYQREKRYLHKDGAVVWGLVTVSALRDEGGQFLGSSAQVQDITAQKVAEVALRDHEARLESLVEQLPIVLYSQPWGGSHAFRYVSPRFERQTGLRRDDLPDHFAAILKRAHPDDRDQMRTVNDRANRTGETVHLQYRLRGGNGDWRWMDHRSVLRRDEQGQPVAWHGSIIDISERKRLEASLWESEERFRFAFKGAAIGMAIAGADDTCLDANAAYCAIVGVPREALIGRPIVGATHPNDRTNSASRLARVHHGELDSYEVAKRYLRPDGTVVNGLLTISAVRDDAGALRYCIGQLRDVTAQRATEAALRESEEILRSVIEQAPAAVYQLEPGPDGRFTYASPRFRMLTGLSIDAGVTKLSDFFPRVHPEDIARLQAADAEAARSGESFDIEYRLRGEDGAWTWVHDRSTPARDEAGRVVVWHGVLLDVSERKALQQALAEREERLRVLVEQLPVAVYSLEPAPAAHYTYVSPRFGALTGMSPAEIARGSEALFARIHPDDVERVREADRSSNATKGPHAVEFRVRHVNGEGAWVWLQERAMLAHDGQGGPLAWHGVLLDVSEQRRLEESVRDNEARFRSTFEGAAIGMALSTPDCRVIMANPALERLLGYGPGELEGVDSDTLTYAADLAEHARYRARMTAGEIDGYHLEKRYVRKDGELVWVVQSVTAIRDDHGAVQTVIAQIQDITSRKEAEEALRASEARFRSAFEGAGIGMSLADLHGRFFDANPAFCRFLGYSRDELRQRTYLDITHPGDRAMSLDYTGRLFRDEVAGFSTEKRYIRADGQTVWGDLTITTVGDADGVPLYEIAQVQDITARKEAEAALRESEGRFRSTFEGAGIGMTLADAEGAFIDVNPAFCALLGRSRDELIGHNFLDVTHPDDRAANLAQVARLQAGDIDSYAIEKRYIHASGRIVWGRLTVSAVRGPDGSFRYEIAQIEDITARKQVEEALRASEARFRAVVQNDPDVVIIIDDRLQVVYASPSSLAAFGEAPEALFGAAETCLDRIHPEDVDRVLALNGEVSVAHGAVASTEARVKHTRHGWRWFQVTVANLIDDPGIAGFLVNMRDITERKQAELATISALQAKEAAISELERLNQSKSRFLSTISHEFRTPLTAIIGYSELLASASRSKAVLEDAAVINREARRLNRMVDDVLLLDRVDGRHLSLISRPLDLNAIVHDVVKTFRPLTDEHELILRLDPDLPPVNGHADRLAQALTNLVSNAIKYSPAGGTITISTRHEGDEATISVQDEGIGIAEDDQQRVFERFERIESGIAGRIAGTGLGLSIVQEIATAHGGRAWVESEPGHGSRFTLAIPARASDPSPLPVESR